MDYHYQKIKKYKSLKTIQMNLVLPKLKKVSNQPKKRKIFLISDDVRFHSGIATMSREIIEGTCNEFDWVQLGAGVEHPEHGKIIDVSADLEKKLGIENVDVKIYAHNGYGNPDVVREIINREKPDALMIFTDPRFFEHIFMMEHDIHYKFKIPLIYYSIWDNYIYPYHNIPFYESCDALLGISKQSHNIHQVLMEYQDVSFSDLPNHKRGDILIDYIPHGVSSERFYPITPESPDYKEYTDWSNGLKTQYGVNHIVFWNNRNIRRKQPADVIWSFKLFLDKFAEEDRSKFALLLKTDPKDQHGTDLLAVKDAICPDLKVIFNTGRIDDKGMNWLYNLSDVTLNIASNEGFGLSQAESIMAGTPVVGNVTGGLQDTMKFVDPDTGEWIVFNEEVPTNHAQNTLNCGKWAFPVFPSNRSLQGSLQTPYILDDRCQPQHVADALFEVYLTKAAGNLTANGLEGREWMMTDESGMNAKSMCSKMVKCINKTIDDFERTPSTIIRVTKKKKITETGLL